MYRLELTRGEIYRNSDVLLITGDGKSLLQDIDRFNELGLKHDKLVIGRSIKAVEPPILHYADVDADEGKWVCENLHKTYPGKANGIIRHTVATEENRDWFDCAWKLKGELIPSDEAMWHGSTAFFAVLIGLEMGYSRIALAGCPMDSKGHWYFPKEKYGPRWTAECYQVWFEFAGNGRADRVKSLSGYTKILLGEPKEWDI